MKKELKWKETEIGKIPEDWELEELGKLGEVATGKRTKCSEYGEYPVIGSNGLMGYCNDYLEDENIIYTGRVGTIGKINYQKKGKIWLSDNVLYFKTRNAELLKFIYYFLKGIDFSYLNVGSTQPLVKQSDFKKLFIPVPKNEDELRLLAKTLYDIDSKIELNQQMNKTLEAIGQAIFKRWFVDFDFPDEEGKPYKSSGGKMTSSALEPIPENWKVDRLERFGKIVCGKTPSKSIKQYFGGAIPFIKIPDMHNKVFVTETEDSLTEEGARSQSNKTIPSGSICVSCIATVGLVSITSKDSQTNQQVNSIVPNRISHTYYLFYQMKSITDHLNNLASGGSTTLNLNTRIFSKMEILRPEETVLERFHGILKPLFDDMLTNQCQNHKLGLVRDTLLPRLMTGKTKVKGYAQDSGMIA